MAEVLHLPSNSTVDDIIEVVEREGTVIVDDLVSPSWLSDVVSGAFFGFNMLGISTPFLAERHDLRRFSN